MILVTHSIAAAVWLGPMARMVTDLAKFLDSMVGYDPGDPVTAYDIGNTADSYSAALDKCALKAARVQLAYAYEQPLAIDVLRASRP